MENNEVEQKAQLIIEKEEKVSIFKKAGDGIKSGAKKVTDFASKHPVATFITGTVVGSAATVGGAVLVNKALQRNDDDAGFDDEVDISDDDVSPTDDVDVNDVDV